MNDCRKGSQRPTLLHEPPDAVDWTISDIAVEFADTVGYVLDEWQEWLVRWAFARRPDGLWAARDYCIEVARQNGKNIVLEVIEVVAVFLLGEDLVIHSAHRTDVSHEHFLSLKAHIEASDELMDAMPLGRPNNGFITANGKESIELANGNRILFKSRQSGSGRGPRPKRIVFDEALILPVTAVGDMAPGMSAQRNPQVVFASSPPKATSDMLHAIRRRALEPEAGDRLFFAGWVNGTDTLPDDHDAELVANPSLGYGRMTVESLRANRKLMGHDDYMREHMGVPEEPLSSQAGPIDPERWGLLAQADELAVEGTVRVCLDAPPDRMSATFGLAGRLANGVPHVQVRRHVPPVEMGDLVQLAKAVVESHGKVPLIVPPGSPALAWRSELVEAGVELDVLSPAEYAEACGNIAAKITEGTLSQRPSPELAGAVAGLAVRKSGDVDVWSRRSSEANIAPFVAVTCALVRVPERVTVRDPIIVYA